MARISRYKPEYAKELLEYFGKLPYVKVEKEVITKSGVETIKVNEATDFPTLSGFAIKIGFHRDTLHDWSTKYPEFGHAYKRAKDFQENYLAINGNKGLIPPAFAIFTAKNVIGWRDKQPGEDAPTVINNITTKSDEELDKHITELLKGKK